ncbi:MAG: NUDIX domain-containing protein [Candidatus Diapherotrites archaeon]|jgi:isopentenyl-diphosphate Delta-isomerase|uniref:NUDIX domain-containing protein n=1 Tax=Candidatus Iainarchaeum sp. TaxID=3101447 RepID=A0A8T5GDK5_9ARCH|nr:NUDIX domain-containing protein [Candidatus Diapherotrites archaeon]
MAELLEMFSDEGELIGSMEKKKFHQTQRKEFFENGKVTSRHKAVKLILMTSTGRVILQRRSKWKGDNAGMWDKTVGGHVTKGDSFDLTMLKECAEELGIPATTVSKPEFEISVVTTDLHVLGILTKLSYLDFNKSNRKQKDGKVWTEPSMTQFYIGYYDGTIRFMDQESCGIQVFALDELEDEIKKNPDEFTDDIKYILDKFSDYIRPIKPKGRHELND